MRFTVPGDPVGKGRPRVVRRGGAVRTYTPEKTATYENLVRLEYERQCGDVTLADAPVEMRITAYYAIAKSDSKKMRQAKLDGQIRPMKKPDLSNVIKSIEDGLNGIAYYDDAQIVMITAEKHYDTIPRVVVEIVEA